MIYFDACDMALQGFMCHVAVLCYCHVPYMIVLGHECLQIRYLGTFCASNVTDTVSRIMKAVMTNSLALQYNWTGSRGKQSFDGLKLSPVICGMYMNNTCFYFLVDIYTCLLYTSDAADE